MFLEHINMNVSDLERSIDFYCRLLDMRVRWRSAPDAPRDGVHIGDEQSYLALFQADGPGPSHPNGHTDPVGVNHFGFVVDDLDEVKRRLVELGTPPYSEADYEPGRRVYFRDPDGFDVELVSYAPGESPVPADAQAG